MTDFGPSAKLYMVHAGDLMRIVETFLAHDGSAAPALLPAAYPTPLTMRRVLEIMAEEAGKRAHFLRVPPGLAVAGLRSLETIGMRLPFRSDSLLSMLHTNPAPELVPEVSLPEGSQFPVVSADRLTLYFATERTDAGTKGSFDIWVAHRTTVTGAFSTPTPLPELSSAAIETPGWLSADNCRMYLESDRLGTMDIFVATRQPID